MHEQASPLAESERAEREEGSRNVASVARKAHSLYRHQLKIEEQVDKRCVVSFFTCHLQTAAKNPLQSPVLEHRASHVLACECLLDNTAEILSLGAL